MPSLMKRLALLAVIILVLGAQSPTLANLLVNGGFEQWSGNTPASWGFDYTGNAMTSSADTGRSGSGYSLKMNVTSFVSQAQGSWVIACQDNQVQVAANQWYKLTFWAKATGVDSAAATVMDKGVVPWVDTIRLAPGMALKSSWQKYTCYMKTTRASTNTRFEIYLTWHTGQGPCTLWLDDVDLVSVDAGESANYISTSGLTNYVPNSSFELGTTGWGTLESEQLYGTIDSTTAADGANSLRLHYSPSLYPDRWTDWPTPWIETIVPANFTNIGWFSLAANTSYTVSVWMKQTNTLSGSPSRNVTLALQSKDNPSLSVGLTAHGTTVSVPGDDVWRRYSFTTQVPVSTGAFLTIAPQTPGIYDNYEVNVWVDAVQIEQGSSATQYYPRRPVEGVLTTNHAGNIFHSGDTVNLSATVRNTYNTPINPSFHLIVKDFWNNTVVDNTFNQAFAAYQTLTFNVATGITNTGYYRAYLTLDQGWYQETYSTRFMVLFPYADTYAGQRSMFGINHALISDFKMDLIADTGASWVRDWSLMWDFVENSQGSWYWATSDAFIDRDISYGMSVFECLSQPASYWASSAASSMKTQPYPDTGEGEPQYRWFPPTSMTYYNNFISTVVGRYGSTGNNKISHWEILNEPYWKNYGVAGTSNVAPMTAANVYTFQSAAYSTAKAVDPNCTIIGGVSSYPTDSMYGGLFTLGGLNTCDVVNVHSYFTEENGANLKTDYDVLGASMNSYGGQKPLWASEYGTYADDDPDPNCPLEYTSYYIGQDGERRAAESIVRQLATGFGAGMQCAMYHGAGWVHQLNNEWTPYDMFEYGGIPRKTFAALNVMAWMLPPGTTYRSYGFNTNRSTYIFAKGATTTAVVFAVEGSPYNVSSSAHSTITGRGVSIKNAMGNEIPAGAFNITDSPVYFVGSDSDVRTSLSTEIGMNLWGPLAPSNPGSTDITPTSIRWTWQNNALDDTGYYVYCDPGAGPPSTLRAVTADVSSWNYTGLTPNSPYCFQVKAWNYNGASAITSNIARYTLGANPSVSVNVICNRTINTGYPSNTRFGFYNPSGFGVGKVSYFRYAWDKSATHTWTGSETSWNSGTLNLTPSSGAGNYYLHLRSYNADNAANPTTLGYGPFLCTDTSAVNNTAVNGDLETWTSSTQPGTWSVSGTCNRESTIKVGGTYSAKLTGDQSLIRQTVTGKLIPGVAYKLCGWIRKDAGTGMGRLAIKDSNWNALVIADGQDVLNTWIWAEKDFVATGTETYFDVWNFVMGSSGICYYDNVGIYLLSSKILNGPMESWTSSAVPANWSVSGTCNQESTIKAAGNYSAKVTGGSFNAFVRNDVSSRLVPGYAYKVCGWVRKESGGGVPRLAVKDWNWTEVANAEGQDILGTWQWVERDFIATGAEIAYDAWNFSSPSSVCYYDDTALLPDENPVTDSGLEAWNSATVPTNWSVSGTCNRESTIKVDGSYSAKVTGGSYNALIRQTVSGKFTTGKTYKLCGWIYKQSGDGYGRLAIKDSSFNELVSVNCQDITGSWQWVEKTFVATGGEYYLDAWNFMNMSGSCFFDNVMVIAVDNPVVDSGIEAWTSATQPTNWSYSGICNRESTIKVGGAYSAKVTGGSYNALIRQNVSGKLTAGKTYKLCGWIYKQSGDGYGRLAIKDGSWNEVVSVNCQDITGSWQWVEKTFVATGVETYLDAWNFMGTSGVCYYDNVMICQMN